MLTADSANPTASALTLRPDQRLPCNTNPATRVGLVLCARRITTRLIRIPTHAGCLIARIEIRVFTAYPRRVPSAKAKVLFVSLLLRCQWRGGSVRLIICSTILFIYSTILIIGSTIRVLSDRGSIFRPATLFFRPATLFFCRCHLNHRSGSQHGAQDEYNCLSHCDLHWMDFRARQMYLAMNNEFAHLAKIGAHSTLCLPCVKGKCP
jgi:hypothetical protein